jgi:hypothetical protein
LGAQRGLSTQLCDINSFAGTVVAKGGILVVISLEAATRALKVIEIVSPIYKQQFIGTGFVPVTIVFPSVVRSALVKECAGEVGVGGIFHGEGETNIRWEMTEQSLVGGNFFDEFIVFEGSGTYGRKNRLKQLDLLLRVLGKLRRRELKALVNFLKTRHEERGNVVWFSPPFQYFIG